MGANILKGWQRLLIKRCTRTAHISFSRNEIVEMIAAASLKAVFNVEEDVFLRRWPWFRRLWFHGRHYLVSVESVFLRIWHRFLQKAGFGFLKSTFCGNCIRWSSWNLGLVSKESVLGKLVSEQMGFLKSLLKVVKKISRKVHSTSSEFFGKRSFLKAGFA